MLKIEKLFFFRQKKEINGFLFLTVITKTPALTNAINSHRPSIALLSVMLEVVLVRVFRGGRGQVIAPYVVMLEGKCG